MADKALPSLVYIGGFGRSGSTLVERLLGQYPGVCCAGEVRHMWQRGIVERQRCGCGEPFTECAFWNDVSAAAFGGWDRVDLDRVARLRDIVDRTRVIPLLAARGPRLSLHRDVEEYTSYYLQTYRGLAEVSGRHIVVDSSKHASLAFCLRHRAELDLRVIHVVRDSRAVAYSWTRSVRRPDTVPPTLMRTYRPSRAAWHWNVQNGALGLLARVGIPTLLVRYEDLVADPEPTVARIAAFAGAPADRVKPRFMGSDGDNHWADLKVAHTVSGNPMRFATGRITIQADDVWRTRMPAAQERTVTSMTMPLLRHYGYPARRSAG